MLKTEMRNEKTKNIDKMSTYDMLMVINEENSKVIKAVEKEIPNIVKAVDEIASAFNKGGRLIYVGAGTSGRLGILDAAECPPTFGVSKNTVVAIIAGGKKTIMDASEGAEDNEEKGIEALNKLKVNDKDVVVGISAAGSAAYVIGALKTAKDAGALTIALTCNKPCKICELADISISPDTGPEVITGSTRLKAGTAQKLVLNMLSTGAMIKTGKVYENFMINVKPVNKKLRNRCIWIITQITGADEKKAEDALDKAKGSIKEAIESISGGKK